MDNDPMQLQNLYPAPDGSEERLKEQELEAQLVQMRRCSGIAGRETPRANAPFCE